MNESLKTYLLIALIVLSGVSIKSLTGNKELKIENLKKYEDVVDEVEKQNNASSNDYSEAALNAVVSTPSSTPITLDMLSIEEIYEFDSETIDYYYEKYCYSKAIEYIMNKYNWSYDTFVSLASIVLCEASSDYIDGYWVVNTMYNRTITKNWVAAHGTDMYNQAIAPGQFVVFESGSYYSVYNNFTSQFTDPAFRGIIDFLVTNVSLHNYLNFHANGVPSAGEELSCSRGNVYYNEIKPENLLDEFQLTLVKN